MEAFASQLRLVMAEEGMAMSTIDKAGLALGHAPTTMPALQDAYGHLDKAASLATGGGASPYDDIGTRLLDLISDEQTMVQQMLGDYGDPSERADYRRIQEDHQRLLAMLRELQQRGY
jgi:hypothetical protein